LRGDRSAGPDIQFFGVETAIVARASLLRFPLAENLPRRRIGVRSAPVKFKCHAARAPNLAQRGQLLTRRTLTLQRVPGDLSGGT
jgi:hypothetical protein